MDFQYLFFAIFITMDCATSLRRFFTFQNFHSMSFNWHRTVAKRYVSTRWIKKHTLRKQKLDQLEHNFNYLIR